jgi:hypothetical protein
MWSPAVTFDDNTLREGIVLRHLDGIPPRRFETTWSRDATVSDVVDAIDQLLTELWNYMCEKDAADGLSTTQGET